MLITSTASVGKTLMSCSLKNWEGTRYRQKRFILIIPFNALNEFLTRVFYHPHKRQTILFKFVVKFFHTRVIGFVIRIAYFCNSTNLESQR